MGSSSARGCSQTILYISAFAAASTVHHSHSDISLGCFHFMDHERKISMKILQFLCLSFWTFSLHRGSTDTSPETTRNSKLDANCPRCFCLRERERLCVRSCLSVCHARTDEEEVEVWEAEMDDGAQTI